MAPEHPAPQQVEPPVDEFVNRAAELAWLHSQRKPIIVLPGMSGIGKSELARSFAASVRDRFPGGQLHIDRAAFTEDRVDLSGMVGSCLSALRVADAYQPQTLAERIQLFQARTSERPCLILLENATEAGQVTALKPANGLIVATTQEDLSELTLDGAAFLNIRPLDAEHSLSLFSAVCVDAPPQARDLVPYAAGMPLAIKIMAGRVGMLHDMTIDEYAAELADDERRLSALTLGGRGVEAAFTLAYHRLPFEVRRLYRLLALLPGHDFAPETAAAVATAPDVRPLLRALAGTQLLEKRPGGRYGFHDLVRIHAKKLAQDDPAEQRAAAEAQAVRHYLVRAAYADRAVMGPRSRATDHDRLLAGSADPFAAATPEERRKLGDDWFQAERFNLRAAVTAAEKAGRYEECWQLAEALVAFYYNHRYLTEWTSVSEIGVRAAGILADGEAEARLRISASRAFTNLEDLERAAAELDRAEDLADGVDEPARRAALHASIWEFRGRVLDQTDKPAALAAYERARDLNASVGERRGADLCVFWHACTLADLGRLDESRAALSEVLESFGSRKDLRMAPRVQIRLADVLHRMGRTGESLDLLESSLPALEGTHYEAEARELLAELAPDSALEHLRRAWEIYDSENNPRADILRAS